MKGLLPEFRLCLLLLAFAMLLTPSCQGPQQRFRQMERSFRDDLAPLLTNGGASKTALAVVSPYRVDQSLKHLEDLLTQLEMIPEEELAESTRAEFARFLQQRRHERDSLASLRRDPSLYNLGGYLKRIIADVETSPENKLERLDQALENAEAYYDSAKAILNTPSPQHLELAIRKQQESLVFLTGELPQALNLVPEPGKALSSRQMNLLRASYAVKDYLAYCRSLLFDHQDSTLLLKR